MHRGGWGLLLLGGILLAHAAGELGAAHTAQRHLWRQYQVQEGVYPPVAAAKAPLGVAAWHPAAPVCCVLDIPRLHLRAVVLQGTTEAVLAQAPGHLPGSAAPGATGNMVISAHNVLFFRHLDLLRPGDPVYLTVGGHRFVYVVHRSRVVPVDGGSIVMDPLPPTLTLTSCYPLDGAILHPPWRFVVTARLQGRA
ncbi:MAG: class D sortase [Thermaerobacter sp.]|jgi:LPXTG-site transpeptidase (sortase) family protein|nr:class D sortase [Thermaerobacter sp.]